MKSSRTVRNFGKVESPMMTPHLLPSKEHEEDEEREKGCRDAVAEDQQEREKQPKYVFCVVGQTLPRSKTSVTSPSQVGQMTGMERDSLHHCVDDATQQPQDDPCLTLSRNDEYPTINNRDTESKSERNLPREERATLEETTEVDIRYRVSPELQDTETGVGMKCKKEHPYAEIGPIQRDSQTERLLLEWREKNKEVVESKSEQSSPLPNNPYADVWSQVNFEQIQPILDGINTGVMSPEEVEAIRIRMSGAWSMSEEPKRHSQAPHLKWAKNVVREILGQSDERAVDGPELQGDQGVNQCDTKQQEEVAQETEEMPDVMLRTDKHSEPELEEEEPLEVEGLRGMGQSKADMHADQFTAMHGDTPTYTHADTLDTEGKEDHSTDKETEPSGQLQPEQAEIEIKIGEEVERVRARRWRTKVKKKKKKKDRREPEEGDKVEEESEISEEEATEVDRGEGEVVAEKKAGTLSSTCSFRDLGPEARLRRRGIRKTTERRKRVPLEAQEEEGVGRDRRTRIFSTTDAAQLYQQYSEAAQNFEILRQARSDVTSVCEDITPAPAPSVAPACRPLPPIPPVQHPHSLFHTGSITSVKSLPLPEPPKSERRPSSPRLSACLTQSAALWRELPGVRNSAQLEELSEDETRLQEVRFEVVTSEASYCRSLDIVVEHFVKSKQLGALLTTQDRNWLFSRLADVRAISFLSKLEERVESDIMNFTVCDIIARHCQRFKMVYVPYLTNQSYQDATYQRLMNENPGFKRIVEKLERSPVCQRLPLRSFLVLPFQRITRIKLLVQNIVKRTTPGTPEATQAIKSLKLLEKLIQESNDSITQMKTSSLWSPLVRRWTLSAGGGRFTVIEHSPVSDLRAENCRVKLHSLQKNLFRLHMSNEALFLRTDTQSDKLRWISALSRPHPEIDFSAAQDFTQMQCIRAFVAQQPDELSLEKADVILVHQQSSDHWVEGTRLSDRHRGWVPESHLETISNSRVRERNLSDALKLTTATAAV
ncbi:Rho guanine nucleotide exchange factor 5 [Larimichthys crocea]|uniref:Rho guanine nucleotide exchange factor 5 n=1 Tax=Larimichthys crocea TaxID=215358 RepID=A0A6G0IC04_LARCR|nr:Rho guanine nucleotide exchange factor 5 [Larimichthys crocea]